MRLWEVDFREVEANAVATVWETRRVLAESFDAALSKARKTEKEAYPTLKLEVVRCELKFDNIDEEEA